LPGGRVLVVGGIVAGTISRKTEVYDPASGRWTRGADTNFAHAQQTALPLRRGRILVLGGYGGGPEVYDPLKKRWSRAGLTAFRAHPIITVLSDGSVLVAAGTSAKYRDLRSSRVFSPSTGRWMPAGRLRTPRNDAVGMLLPSGHVLAAGGQQVTMHVLRSAELYNPATRSWSATAPMLEPRDDATAALLPDKTVLVCGGMNLTGVLSSCETYHP